MEAIKLNCTYEERTSKSDDKKKYKAIFIKISDNYEKVVFVSVPEQALIESNNKEQDYPYNY